MTGTWGRFFRTMVVVAFSGSASALVHAEVTDPLPRLRVEQPEAYFDPPVLKHMIDDAIRPDTRERLQANDNALWLLTSRHALKNGANYCAATVGVTEAAEKGQSARIPKHVVSNFIKMDARGVLKDDQVSACRYAAAAGAVRRFAAASVQDQFQGIDDTRNAGGHRKVETANAEMANVSSWGITGSQVLDQVPADFRRTFDYRQIQFVVFAAADRFDENVFCVAHAGVTYRQPPDRTARFPSHYFTVAWEMTAQESLAANAEQRCRQEEANDAVRDALSSAWDASGSGLFSGLEQTRERDVPPLTRFNLAAKAAPPRATAAPVRAGLTNSPQGCSPPPGKTVRYSDRCNNGDCVRTFENGCSVRFQAPYCYDPLQQRWTWKPDGC